MIKKLRIYIFDIFIKFYILTNFMSLIQTLENIGTIFKKKSKNSETIWEGNDFFDLLGYITINEKEYGRFITSVFSPESRIFTFNIPKSALLNLTHTSNSIEDFLLTFSPLDKYRIIVNNNNIQRVYLSGTEIYNRISHGF